MKRVWRSNVILRKGRRYGAVPVRALVFLLEGRDPARPPVLANSVPKSGTHLLIQVLGTLPGTRDWGLFLATTPSFRFSELPVQRLARRLRHMVDGELAGAHLHYDARLGKIIQQRGAASYLIYRDPRDVVVSEAHYLTHMNRWHRLHRYFCALPDEQSRIRLAIEGLGGDAHLPYPSIGERYARYLGWIEDKNTYCVRYEDLVGPARSNTVEGIIAHWARVRGKGIDKQELVSSALRAIEPQASHTFRRGVVGGWREAMDEETLACFHRHAGDLPARLGYPRAAS